MKVLHIVPSLYFDTGGPARSVPELCRALANAGSDTVLFAFKNSRKPVTLDEAENSFRVHYFRPLPFSSQFPTREFLLKLKSEIPDFDLIHLHSLWNPVITLAARVCRKLSKPYLLSPRGMLQRKALSHHALLKQPYYILFERNTVEGAAGFHFLTDAEARESCEFLKRQVRYEIIPSGIDPSLAKITTGKFRSAHPELRQKKLMVFVGRLHWSKNLDLPLKALSILVKQIPDLVWLLIGPDAGEWRKLKRQIEILGLEGAVHWLGPLSQQQVFEIVADADVFILTSHHEAHSIAMNEAAAIGTPIVITDTVQFPELEKSKAGIISKSNANSLAEAVKLVLTDSAMQQRLRENSKMMAGRLFSWPEIARRMMSYYDSICCASYQPAKAIDPLAEPSMRAANRSF